MLRTRRKINREEDTNPTTIEQLVEKYNFDLMWEMLQNGASSSVNMQEVGNMMYPIGSIYMSTVQTNPTDFFGGEWVAWGKRTSSCWCKFR